VKELFFEIGCEEIPARLLEGSRLELGRLLQVGLKEQGLEYAELHTYATPRRLAVSVQVATSQADMSEDILGPPARVAFDEQGKPTKAAVGFAQRQGVDVDKLERRQTPKGEYLGLTVERLGKPASILLPELISRVIKRLPWPKAMRWGARRESFIRPVHWMVALFDDEVLPVSYAGIDAARQTRGHRFAGGDPFDVHGAKDWLEGLRANYVEPDPEIRRKQIHEAATTLAESMDTELQESPKLLEEVTGLVEWPVALIGTFEEAYLDLPSQVLVTSMNVHQKYFALRRKDGSLSNHFIVIAGREVRDPEVVVAGNGRVLRARLADARFFFEQDTAQPFEQFVDALADRRFLEGLGTMQHKAERLKALSRRLAETLAKGDKGTADMAARAGYLAKADLATEMVGEFAVLQGEMGRDYARLGGENETVASAIFEHYLPRHAGDRLPDSEVGTFVALADRLDSLVGCFALGLEPSGSADPYALRRQALAVVRILENDERGWSLTELLDSAHDNYGDSLAVQWPEVRTRLLEFFRGRIKAMLTQQYPADLTEAVISVGFDQPADTRGRLSALNALKQTPEWEMLAVGVKRVAKIVVGHEAGTLDPARLTEDAEQGLYEAWHGVQKAATSALDEGNYPQALEHLITLKPAIDRFFDDVLVMSDNPEERQVRLALLSLVGTLFQRIAAFDKVST
jgi:glycyl-tRNA synthetase beta chain